MDRFLSSDLGRNVRSDAPQEEGRQERLGNIPVVLAHHVSAARAGDDTHRSSRAPFPLRSRPSERLYIDPQNELMAILYQSIDSVAHHRDRPVLLVGQFLVGIGRRHMRLIRAALLSKCDRRIAGVLVLRMIQ